MSSIAWGAGVARPFRRALLAAVVVGLGSTATARADVPVAFGIVAEDPGPGRLLPEGRSVGFAEASVTFPDGGKVRVRPHVRGAFWRGPGRCRPLLVADASLFVVPGPVSPGGTPHTVTLVTGDGSTRPLSGRIASRTDDAPPRVAVFVELPADVPPGLPHRRFVVVDVMGIARNAACERRLKPMLHRVAGATTIRIRGAFVAPPPLDLPPAVDVPVHAAVTVGGNREYAAAGERLVALGDVDGDARTDLAVNDGPDIAVVTAPRRGTLDLADGDGAVIMRLRAARSVAAAGDVDGDGLDDVVVGAPGRAERRGVVRVLRGRSRDAAVSAPLLRVVGPRRCAGLGEDVDSAGDVDGDGRGDVVISGETCGNRPSSSAWLVYGGRIGTEVDLRRPAGDAVALHGLPRGGDVDVAGVGDVNGDGLADVAVGAPFYTGAGATIVLGARPRDGIDLRNPGLRGVRIDGAPCEEIGGTVAPGGDVNGDGLDDVLLGSDTVCDGAPFPWGRAYVVFGGPPGTVSTFTLGDRGLRLDGLDTYRRYIGIASAGDQDGDGLDDLLVADGREVLLVPGRREAGDISLRTLGTRGKRYVGLRLGSLRPPGLATLPDVDGDGRPELAFGSSDARFRGRRRAGRVLILPSRSSPERDAGRP